MSLAPSMRSCMVGTALLVHDSLGFKAHTSTISCIDLAAKGRMMWSQLPVVSQQIRRFAPYLASVRSGKVIIYGRRDSTSDVCQISVMENANSKGPSVHQVKEATSHLATDYIFTGQPPLRQQFHTVVAMTNKLLILPRPTDDGCIVHCLTSL